MRKKIVIDGVIFGLQRAGGISHLFAEILRGLEESRNFEIILLLPKNRNVEFSSLDLKHTRVVKRRRFKWGRSSYLGECLYLTFLALRFRPELWHSSYYVGFPLLFGGKRCITYHDMISEIHKTATSYETSLKYRSLKQADKIFSISHHSKKDLLHFWPSFSDKTAVIENGITVKEPGQKGSMGNYFLFLGKRRGYKNFLPTVKAILKDPRFKNYKIYAVGGEEPLSEEELPLERVIWFPTLPSEKIGELLLHATALLFPSLYEGFGFPLLEAFCYGVPALAYRTTSIPEVTGELYPLIDPQNSSTLADVLQRLIDERECWVEYGRRRAALFDRKTMIDKLQNEYAL